MTFVPDVLVLGSGLTAACCSYEFARRGHRVEVYGEDLYGHAPVARKAGIDDRNEHLQSMSALGLATLHEVRRQVGESVLRSTGSLTVAVDSLEWAHLQFRAEKFKDAGIACESVGGGILPAIEECLSFALPGGVYLPDGLAFDPTELVARLLQSVERASFGPRFRLRRIDGLRAEFASGESAEGGLVIDASGLGHGLGRLREVSATVFFGPDPLTLPVSTASAHFVPTAWGWEAVSVRPVQTYQEIRRTFPSFGRDDTRALRWWTTQDALPVVGPVSENDGVFVLGALEGHDLSAVTGAACLLSAMAESRRSTIDAAPFSPTRISLPDRAKG